MAPRIATPARAATPTRVSRVTTKAVLTMTMTASLSTDVVSTVVEGTPALVCSPTARPVTHVTPLRTLSPWHARAAERPRDQVNASAATADTGWMPPAGRAGRLRPRHARPPRGGELPV